MKTKSEYIEDLQTKIKYLTEIVWENRINLVDIKDWLAQFEESSLLDQDEQLHALFLLSNFIYFGQPEIRELLKSLYRDLFRSPLIHSLRRANNNSRDQNFLNARFGEILNRTRFLAVGNPSESGAHLLYYFRQENSLAKTLFINSHEIFKRTSSGGVSRITVRDPTLEYYVFIDDLCGSGTQAGAYSVDLVNPLKRENANAKVFYFVLFAEKPFIRERVRVTCSKYGARLWPPYPLGYKGGQLLIGFNHNTPDNTLPIFWQDESTIGAWRPIFKRYHKDYG